MEKNLNLLKGLVFSQRVLLALTQAGVSREDAYLYVQRNAMQVWQDKKEFKILLAQDQDIKNYLTQAQIEELFDMSYHTKNIDKIYNRIF